ncbi:MAG TPA: acetate--CoA ligase family protein [Acidisphaera sp.]|nr:acetate--CoA ligase family protein [Acidisphaera sp.]
MTLPRLHELLSPRSVAIVGASPDATRIRGALLHMLRKNGFPGAIYPVNPSYPEIGGLRCYPSAAAIGENVDLALVAIPAAAVPDALEACAAAGVRNAVIISSGFAEDAEAPPDLQDRIAAIARRTGMRVCGPNGEGFFNEVARVTATFSPAVEHLDDAPLVATRRRVGVISQSGGIGFAFYNRGRALGLPFSSIVSTGNEADLTASDFFAHMAEDPQTGGILLFLESIRDPALFRAAATAAREAGKPVVAIKIGRSAAGRQAAASHTASLTGWDAGYDALFRRYGIAVAADLDEALAMMGALMTNPRATGRRVAILTISGGGGVLAADVFAAAGLEVPELSADTQARIRAFIPSYGSARNPVDLTAQGAHGGGTLRAAALLMDDDAVDMIAIVTSLANPTRPTLDGPTLRDLVARQRKPVLVYSYTLPSELGLRTLADAGVVVTTSMALTARAARALVETRKPVTVRRGALPVAVAERLRGTGVLAEHAAKHVLREYGIAVGPSRLVTDARGLDDAAALGFPLALKIQSPDIVHKTEAGGVRLGIADRAALQAAFYDVLDAARRHAPDVRVGGVLVERMAPRGREMIVGVVRDPVVGPVVTLGAGGTEAELFRDVAHRLAPVDEQEAHDMLAELRAAPLLHGWRGAPAADVAALTRLVALVSQLGAAEQVAELELNPVIVHAAGQGCTIADALIVLGKTSGG